MQPPLVPGVEENSNTAKSPGNDAQATPTSISHPCSPTGEHHRARFELPAKENNDTSPPPAP